MIHHTVFLRLEGPLQAWGDTSKFVVRRSMDAPTKSGVLGLICCAMGLSRQAARDRLVDLNGLTMGVRIDRAGTRWWDYHTVGAGIGLITAAGKLKMGAQGTLVTRREYLADASFLVALSGDAAIINEVALALSSPMWPIYLGRKSCSPAVPILARPREGESWTNPGIHSNLTAALEAVPWPPRYDTDAPYDARHNRIKTIDLPCLIEWCATELQTIAPAAAEVWYDAPVAFTPQVHQPRLVVRKSVEVMVGKALQQHASAPPRPRANYTNSEWTSERLVDVVNERTGEVTREPYGARPRRLHRDHGLCVFCKSPANTVQHVTYRRAGGDETQEDLRSLCRLCHDAVTMIEYGLGMGLDRINPEDSQYRERIIAKRTEIIQFRSLENRRRQLQAEEIE
ncbi:MAG: type I-E CRISPR-associated protein Cas5/CasD [Planctomycetota bacterium]|nr:type I-E CRISPR-associated protein Cas5/CasD [Planctomycetota bacterium]